MRLAVKDSQTDLTERNQNITPIILFFVVSDAMFEKCCIIHEIHLITNS